jgi:hypothetical protein
MRTNPHQVNQSEMRASINKGYSVKQRAESLQKSAKPTSLDMSKKKSSSQNSLEDDEEF